MDMEKITIYHHADYLQFKFPNRKWYEISQSNRIALMRLDFSDTDFLECDIALALYEDYTGEPIYRVQEGFFEDLYKAML